VGYLGRDCVPSPCGFDLAHSRRLGWGAVFAGIVRAPITSVLIIFEMTGGYGLVLPLMIANMSAFALARHWRRTSIYDALLAQDGSIWNTGPTRLIRRTMRRCRDGAARSGARLESRNLASAVACPMCERDSLELGYWMRLCVAEAGGGADTGALPALGARDSPMVFAPL